MYAAARTIPYRMPVMRRRAKQTSAFEQGVQKCTPGGAFQNVSCDCIKYLKLVDPCMGSGHILVYAFDVLMQIYLSVGYSERDAAKSIVENNLYGLDIDDRAAQLAYFALMMKARQYDSRFLTRGVQPHVYAIQESNALQPFERLSRQMRLDTLCLNTANDLIATYRDAKEYGSLLSPKINSLPDVPHLMRQLEEVSLTDLEIQSWYEKAARLLPQLARQTEVLQQRYDVVVTNPPYMGSSGMNSLLSSFVKEEYPDSKADLFAVFIERCGNMTVKGGYTAMITQHAWMFLSSYEKLRKKMNRRNIINMAHLGARAFDEIGGEVVQTTAFITYKPYIKSYIGTYIRLTEPTSQDEKEQLFLSGENRYLATQNSFQKIPGIPIAYSISKALSEAFSNGEPITNYVDTFLGIITGDNEKFLRLWHEVQVTNIAFHAQNYLDIDLNYQYWIPYNKGGDFRRWYGIQDYVINWENGPIDKRRGKKDFQRYYLREYGAWSYTISSSSKLIATRYYPKGFLWDVRGSGIFDKSKSLYYLLSLISSVVGYALFRVKSEVLSCQVENILEIPVIMDKHQFPLIEEKAKRNIDLSSADWDSFETSWDFKRHPLL